MMQRYFFDNNNIRCNLIQTRTGKGLNWLFVPGGPGADSRYLNSLTRLLDLPGNVWLVDLPGNGDHAVGCASNYDYNQWFEIFPQLVKRFDHPVVVGHSFGAMLVMLCPELEGKLTGFVSLNSSPALWLEEATKAARVADLPDLTNDMTAFIQNSNQSTFDQVLQTCMPYYFPHQSMDQGKKMLAELPFQYNLVDWALRLVIDIQYKAKWAPKEIPMLIINADRDYMCPPVLFQQDERFHGPNITSHVVQGAGHFPWIERPNEVARLFHEFMGKL